MDLLSGTWPPAIQRVIFFFPSSVFFVYSERYSVASTHPFTAILHKMCTGYRVTAFALKVATRGDQP